MDTDKGDGEWNDSSTLNDADDEAEDQRTGPAVDTETPDSKKLTKAEKKMAKNQVKFDVISKELLKHIQELLHPMSIELPAKVGDDQGLVNNTTIQSNIAFNGHTFRRGTLRQRVNEKKLAKANAIALRETMNSPQEDEKVMKTMLQELGVNVRLSRTCKERRNLEAKLRTAIKADNVAHENERAETMQRMAGYWRYVNRRTYNAMVRTNMLWDWSTGAKLPELEVSEIGDIEEVDKASTAGSTDADSQDTTVGPETYDGDFDIPEDQDRFDLALKAQVSESEELNDKTPTQSTFSRHDDLGQEDESGLTYSPGRSPGPTLTFAVPSPGSDELDCDDSTVTLPKTPTKSTSNYTQSRDTRLLPLTIRPASPVTPTAANPPPAYHTTRSHHASHKSTSKSTTNATNAANTFGIPNADTPCPAEDLQSPPSTPFTTPNPRNPTRKATTDPKPNDPFPALPYTIPPKTSAKPAKALKILSINASGIPDKANTTRIGSLSGGGRIAAPALMLAGRRVGGRAAAAAPVKAEVGGGEWTAVVRKGRGGGRK